MNNDHYTPQGVHPNCYKSQLSARFICNSDRMSVLEHMHRIGEIDAVLSQIAHTLPNIPFIPHLPIVCTIVRTVKIFARCLT